jgi:hypothetical protein
MLHILREPGSNEKAWIVSIVVSQYSKLNHRDFLIAVAIAAGTRIPSSWPTRIRKSNVRQASVGVAGPVRRIQTFPVVEFVVPILSFKLNKPERRCRRASTHWHTLLTFSVVYDFLQGVLLV